jgi:phenolic acid decarboxylase
MFAFQSPLTVRAGASAPRNNPPPQLKEKKMGFAGKRFLYRYESGLEVKGYFKSETELEWEGLTGPSRGLKGAEKIYADEVASNVFFISWLEKTGVSVSQVLDLGRSRVTAFVTYSTDQGRISLFDKGSITELKD